MRASLFGTLAGGGGGVTPIALVAHAAAGASDTSNATTPPIDTTGATLLVVVTARYQAAASVSDSKSNTWVALTDRASAGDATQMFYCKNPTVGTGHTFTANSPAGYPSCSVAAFNNTDTTANADQENGATSASAATLATGSVTPSVDNELIVAGVAHDQASQTINSGFTIAANQPYLASNHIGSALAYLVQTTAAPVNATWDTTLSGNICAAIATFKHS